MDACLIAAGQRAEHYEMAAYGTLVALAEGGINQGAADAAHPEEDEKEPAAVGAGAKKTAAPKAKSGSRR